MWALGFIISLLIGLVVGHFMIPILHKLKFGQSIREEGPRAIRQNRERQRWAGSSL